jgi:hypothetical protein
MWTFPLKRHVVGITRDSMSFLDINVSMDIEIPCGNHVGAFGVERRCDIHKGVDLYCMADTFVYAVEDGVVVDIRCFTGALAGSPWWADTQAISVEGQEGIVVYGEVSTLCKIGDRVEQEQPIARVRRVLKEDKGRPTTMLHFCLHNHGILRQTAWKLGTPQPVGLIDPTNRLIASVWENTYEDLSNGRVNASDD